ncbi:MAG: hypothetical protein Q9174_005100 [Haloplaca sp. 1 TL-2023]
MTIAWSIVLLIVFAHAIPQPEDFRAQTIDRKTPEWAIQKIDKAALQNSLEYLDKGLFARLPTVAYQATEWVQEYIPQWCLDQSSNQHNGFNPAKDIKVYDIRYTDCGSPWIVCIHKDSPMDINGFAELFSRIPVASRSFVRHVLTVPGASEAGANSDGDIVFENLSSDDVATIIHEVGHSLDKFAYGEQLSFSSDWRNKANKDKSVPNAYAASSAIEDVAESSIVATYNMLVPGGFPSIESRWKEVRNQYETVQTWQRVKADNVMRPGGSCRKRFKNSDPVNRPSAKKLLRGRWALWSRSPKPDTSLAEGIEVIQPGHFESGRCVRKH